MEQKDYLVIGFTILKVELNRKYRLHRFAESQIEAKSDYIKSKHIFLRTNLKPGRYVIVVTTFSPNESTDFLLRLFSEKDAKLTGLTKNLPVLKWYQKKAPKLLTRITILDASDLTKQDVFRRKLMIDQRLPTYFFMFLLAVHCRIALSQNQIKARSLYNLVKKYLHRKALDFKEIF